MGKDIELALLFADVVNSTRLFEQLGDLRAREMLGICIEVMSAATQKYEGTVIKTIGDEVMATFPRGDAALDAAAQMQEQISSHRELRVQGRSLAIRIGCHYGPVVLEPGDVFGATVHIAKRAATKANARQIITTEATVDTLSTEWRTASRRIGVETLKGVGQPVTLFEVLWQREDATSLVTALVFNAPPVRLMRLRLHIGDRDVLLDEQTPSVTIGRHENCDFVVQGNMISRQHARIEISRNKFMLIDQSTNGTFVHTTGGAENFVRGDSLQIEGEGMIGLGRLPDQDSPQTIRFVCEERR